MSPAELLAADDHFAVCEDCRRHASEPLQMDAVVSGLHAHLRAEAAALESDHLSYEQVAALVDGEIGDAEREALGSHLEICAPCSAWRATRPAPTEVAESIRRAAGFESPRPPAETSPESKPDSSQGDTNTENIGPSPSPQP